MKKRLLAILSIIACMSIGFASPLNSISAMAEGDKEATAETGDSSKEADSVDVEDADVNADQEQQVIDSYVGFIDEFADEWFSGEIRKIDKYLLKNEVMYNGITFEYDETEENFKKLFEESGAVVEEGEVTGKVLEDSMSATVTKIFKCENTDMAFTFTFEAMSSEAKVTFTVVTADEATAAGDSSETADEGEVAESGDFAKAGLNTIMGMGTVFFVLIFISFIIALFVIFSKVGKKPAKTEEVKAAPTPVAAPVAQADNDDEIAVVIAAAIAAYEADANVYDVPADGLYVRSIKKRGFC